MKLEMSGLTERRALQKDPTEDGMALYRQQSLIVARKKESAAEELNQLRQELHALEIQLQVEFHPSNKSSLSISNQSNGLIF